MKILFIEDDFFIADMYVRALKKAGHDVEIINDGGEALKKAKETVYDVILLDIMLPEKTGVEILEELRGQKGDGLPLTKIIVTTNFDEPDEDRARLEQMADGYLIKADVTPSKLVELVEQVTAKSEK
jgi:DNA-binding response OmpR family regulator